MKEDVRRAIIELCEEVERILTERIDAYGANKMGDNTLQGSNLERSIKVTPQDDGLTLEIADYWEYVALGWKRTHRFEGTMPQFILNIERWIKRKNIWNKDLGMTQNQLVFLIIRKIFENGIKARPFMVYDKGGDLEVMIPELKDYMKKWFDDLFDAIMSEIDKYFND